MEDILKRFLVNRNISDDVVERMSEDKVTVAKTSACIALYYRMHLMQQRRLTCQLR